MNTGVKDLWAQNKTHAVVLLAVLLNAARLMHDGGPDAVMSYPAAIETLAGLAISTFKMGVDRIESLLKQQKEPDTSPPAVG